MYNLNEVETCHDMISIWLYFILTILNIISKPVNI